MFIKRVNRVFLVITALFALLLFFTGCGAFKVSPAWSVATSIKEPGKGDYEQSEAYAKGLSGELTRHGIENKLVTFRYNVADSDQSPNLITRTSVIYRDETHPAYPWWLIDNLVRLPVWLPNGSVAEQVDFVTHYQPEILALSQPKAVAAVSAGAPPVSAGKEKLEALFRKDNGTAYDSKSPVDRKKMSALEKSEGTAR